MPFPPNRTYQRKKCRKCGYTAETPSELALHMERAHAAPSTSSSSFTPTEQVLRALQSNHVTVTRCPPPRRAATAATKKIGQDYSSSSNVEEYDGSSLLCELCAVPCKSKAELKRHQAREHEGDVVWL